MRNPEGRDANQDPTRKRYEPGAGTVSKGTRPRIDVSFGFPAVLFRRPKRSIWVFLKIGGPLQWLDKGVHHRDISPCFPFGVKRVVSCMPFIDHVVGPFWVCKGTRYPLLPPGFQGTWYALSVAKDLYYFSHTQGDIHEILAIRHLVSSWNLARYKKGVERD